MTARAFSRLATLLLLCLTAAGCDKQRQRRAAPVGGEKELKHKVVFLSAHGARPYESAQRKLLSRMMAVSPRFDLLLQDAGEDVSLQRSQFKKAVADKPFAIVLDALDPRSLTPDIRVAADAGILIIGLGEKAAGTGCATVVMADQYRLGELAGELTVQALTRKNQEEGGEEPVGRVIEIRGDDLSVRCQQRHEGFVAALRKAPGVILVHDAPGDWSLTGARDRTLDALRLQQTFDVVYAHDDLLALGASAALAQVHRRDEVMIIGTNGFRGPEGGLTLVGDGEIDATLQHPILVDLAWQIVRESADKPSFRPKARYELPARAIQPKDLDEIRLRGLPPLPSLEN